MEWAHSDFPSPAAKREPCVLEKRKKGKLDHPSRTSFFTPPYCFSTYFLSSSAFEAGAPWYGPAAATAPFVLDVAL